MEFVGGTVPKADLTGRLIRMFRWAPSAEDGTPVTRGGNFSTNCYAAPAAATVKAMFTATGTGTRVTVLVAADEEMVGAVNGGGTGNILLSSNPFIPLLKPVLNIGDDLSVQLFRWVFRVGRSVAGTPAADFFGIYFHPYATTSPASPGTTGVGFGIVGDGAGGWSFIARKTSGGALTINQALAWPAAVTRMVDVDIRILPPTSTNGAVLEVRVGGVLKVQESWDNNRLPFLSDAGTSGQYSWSIRNQNAAYPDLYVGRIIECIYAGTAL